MRGKYLIAMDPGQKQDPAAVQLYRATPVLEHPHGPLDITRIIVRDDLIGQWSLADKRYTYLGDFVFRLMGMRELQAQCVLVFDGTGVGAAVKDILHDKGVRDMVPIVYTAGGRVSYVYKDHSDKRFQMRGQTHIDLRVFDEVHVPKADLVDAAVVALEQHQVRVLPDVAYRQEFQIQMTEFTGKMSAKGYVSYNNSSDDIHDEWVNCLMMRSWYRRFYAERIQSANGDRELWGSEASEMAEVIG